jgi:hypothetical protein
MEQDWYCTDMLEMRYQCWWGLGFFKWLLVSPLERQRSLRHNVWFLIVNIQANRVTVVSSIITKIFNPSKYWMVTIQPLLNDTLLISACINCQFLLFDLCSIQCFCLTRCFLFELSAFVSIQIIQCIFCSDTGNVVQVFQSHYITTPTSSQ